jgi:hypothetical protein
LGFHLLPVNSVFWGGCVENHIDSYLDILNSDLKMWLFVGREELRKCKDFVIPRMIVGAGFL